MSHIHENIYIGVLSKRVVLCCIDNDAYNGAYNKNPFHAKHKNLNFLALYVDGQQVPAKPLQPQFGQGEFVRSYCNMFAGTGKMFQDEGNDVTREDFGQGYSLFRNPNCQVVSQCLQLSPDPGQRHPRVVPPTRNHRTHETHDN